MELMLDIGVAATRDALVGLVHLDMLALYLLSEELAARICPLCLVIDAGESHMAEHSEEEMQLLHQHWADSRPDMVIDLYEDEEEDDD